MLDQIPASILSVRLDESLPVSTKMANLSLSTDYFANEWKCAFHRTETPLIRVKNDIVMNMDKGHATLLVLLDLSAAFETVDHTILLRRLQSLLGLRGNAQFLGSKCTWTENPREYRLMTRSLTNFSWNAVLYKDRA